MHDPATIAASLTPLRVKPRAWPIDYRLCKNTILQNAFWSTPIFTGEIPMSPELDKPLGNSVGERAAVPENTYWGLTSDHSADNLDVPYWDNLPDQIRNIITGGPFTAIAVVKTGQNRPFNLGSNADFVCFNCQNGGRQIRWIVNDSAEDRIDTAWTQLASGGQEVVLIGTHETTVEHRLYVGDMVTGELLFNSVDSTLAGSITGTLSNGLYLGNVQHNTTTSMFQGRNYWATLIPGRITEQQAIEIIQDPFGPIRPDPVKLFPHLFKPAAVGGITITGSGGVDLSAFVLAGAGKFVHTGTGTITLAALQLLGSGTVEGIITGSGAISLDAFNILGTGKFVLTGSGVITLPELQVLGAGLRAIQGSGSIELAQLLLSGSGLFTRSGAGAITLDQFVIAGSGLRITTITGSGAIQLLSFTLSGAGTKPILIAPQTALDIVKQAPYRDEFPREFVLWLEQNFSILQNLLSDGATGTFTTTDGKTVTVTNGIITDIT